MRWKYINCAIGKWNVLPAIVAHARSSLGELETPFLPGKLISRGPVKDKRFSATKERKQNNDRRFALPWWSFMTYEFAWIHCDHLAQRERTKADILSMYAMTSRSRENCRPAESQQSDEMISRRIGCKWLVNHYRSKSLIETKQPFRPFKLARDIRWAHLKPIVCSRSRLRKKEAIAARAWFLITAISSSPNVFHSFEF